MTLVRRGIINAIVGIVLVVLGVVLQTQHGGIGGLIPLLIGASLVYLGFRPSKGALILFGHVCIVVGAMMVTWGIYLLPYSKPVLQHVFMRPLFWGLISIFGGICANYHGFCRCMAGGSAAN